MGVVWDLGDEGGAGEGDFPSLKTLKFTLVVLWQR